MRIIILGFSCSGKTTFSTQLGNLLKIPVYHLDSYYWKSPWIVNDDFDIFSLISKESWIIDGTYENHNLYDRIECCDYIFYLDCSLTTRLWRMVHRHITYLLFPADKSPISHKVSVRFMISTIKKVFVLQPNILRMLQSSYTNKLFYIKGVRQIEYVLEEIANENLFELFNSHPK